jgi:molybdopterin-guanine dinucleotide biosynthesis protein A
VNWFLAQEKIPEFLLTASVDVPFFPEDFAARLLEAVEPDGPGAIARCGDQLHPTHGLWRLSALADLPAEAANRTAPKGMRGLAERLGATEAHFERIEGRDPLAGINTLTDLMNAERVILCRD